MSKRKPLLTESELHRFMKLATLRPIAGTRLKELNYPGQREEEFEAEAEVEDPLGGGEELEMDAELDVEEPMGDELEAGGEEEEDLVVSLLQSIQGWAEEHGVEMDLEGGEEEVGVDDLEGGEEEIELGGGEEELEAPGGELEMGPEDEMMEKKEKNWEIIILNNF